MATETITVQTDGITLSLLLWRRLKRRRRPGLLERVYALNPGLGALGATLPFGTIVILPVDTPQSAVEDIEAIALWD